MPKKPIKHKRPVKQVARDFPAFNTLAVKGRPTLDRSRFEQATRGTGQRWGNGIGPRPQDTQIWGFKLPSGRITYASTKPKGKAAAGWFKVDASVSTRR